MQQQINILQLLSTLELPPTTFPNPKECCSFEDLQDKFNDFKDNVKKQKRKLSLKYHPDIPENRTSEKEEKFKAVIDAAEIISKLEIRPTPPRPRHIVIRTQYYSSTASTSTSTWHYY